VRIVVAASSPLSHQIDGDVIVEQAKRGNKRYDASHGLWLFS